MNIYINGRFLTQSITGVQRYAIEVVKAMDMLISSNIIPNDLNFTVLVPKNIFQVLHLKNIKVKRVGFLKGHLWEQLELPLFSRNNLLINLCNTGPAFKKNQIIVIHDMAVFLNEINFSFLFKTWYRILFKIEGRFSKKIVTVSHFSCSEIIKYIHVNPEKIEVIYEGNEHIKNRKMDSEILEKYVLNKRPYLLAVSSLDPRKNFKNILKALDKIEKIDFDVVIAGGTNPKIFKNNQFDFTNKVKYLGYVSDEQLKALYNNASGFIYPSFYEGFGLPPLEAMTLGCPVIVSNRTSLPEICGDSAIYCNPDDPKDIAKKIDELFKNKTMRNYYKNKCVKRASLFSWDDCANSMWKVVKKCLI